MATQQDIKDALDRLTADVAAQTTVVASMKTYVAGISAQLVEMANATKDTTTAQALQALATQIEVNTKSDADAMVANTDNGMVTPMGLGTEGTPRPVFTSDQPFPDGTPFPDPVPPSQA